ncbi:RecF/RecN/SMC domain-containing protein [Clostridium carboxidivorans P7]|uniref:Nuclease SbcCD subunit C n=1 Tax=Clostridium carboxidivorans P7 TaxID=536227 RepID=C6PPQ5_9CLOT|nr:AAA family ATPase [Clostridium carboxidivorans]EET88785.1 RecF/RecN/SMC domain-containing protein [Clostridium carboxidivorans P7]
MIISSVIIENFRGVEGKKTFEFENRNFILLSASNGKGKTTVIDAIEWCLTGDIGRLSSSYDIRSTNNEEKKKKC